MDPKTVREDFFMGRKHLVVPVVALVQSVIHASNAENPELALAKDFGKQPAAWDGRPLTMNHPNIEGFPIPANSPSTLETFQFGQIFNTSVKDNKLVVEAWIDLDRVEAMQGSVKSTVDRILAGETIEVSTGFFADVDTVTGKFEGRTFSGIYRNFVPDHLAFLPDGVKGACSVEMGCGTPRANAESDMKDTGKPGCDCEDKEGECQCDKTADKTHKKLSAGEPPVPAATAAEEDSASPVVSSSAAPTTAEAPASEESATTKKEVPMTDEVIGAASESVTEPAAAAAAPAPEPKAPEQKAPATLEEFVASAPESFKSAIAEGLKLQSEKKSALIQTLTATERCDIPADELSGMSTESLERLVKLAGVETKEAPAAAGDFSARPAPQAAASGQPELYAPMPQPLFAKKSA